METPARHDSPTVLLTVEEAAQRLRIGRTNMFSLIKRGVIPSVRIGQLRRVPEAAVREYVNKLIEQQAA